MKTIEEQIWDYIDRTLDREEQESMQTKIVTDPTYRKIYDELVAVNLQLQQIDIDMPSMAFNRKVMDQVALEVAPVALKTKVDQRIIYTVAALFVLPVLAILLYAIAQTDFKMFAVNIPEMDLDFSAYFTPLFVKIFLFTDMVLGFICLDGFLRRKKI
jgi:hypothetical protein